MDQFRVSIPKTHTIMLFMSIIIAYIIKVYDKKPASFQWVEDNVKWTLSNYMSPESVSDSVEFTISTLILWLCIYLGYRMILQTLLRYKGWMFESRGNVSLFTRAWAAVLSAFSKGLTGFYAFENYCPPLPVPRLEDTVQKYLASMKDLLIESDFEKLKKSAQIFLSSVGPCLQSALMKKWWISSNYVSDWWENYVYLHTRDSLLINSNYFGIGPKFTPTRNQTSRAAGHLWSLLKWRKDTLIDNKALPLKLQKLVPLCPNQYKRFFATSRIPGEQKDEIVTFEGITHVVIFANNKVYRMQVIKADGTPFSQKQLEAGFDAIRADKSINQNEFITCLPASTALDRSKWAKIRHELRKTNVGVLDIVESALLHIWLDDDDTMRGFDLPKLVKRLLHGNGANIWFDKTYSIIFTTEGQFGMNCEHSWADGAVTCHVCEETNVIENLCVEYCPDTGKIIGDEVYVGKCEPLQWSLEKVMPLIEPEMLAIQERINSLDVDSLYFKKFGKDTIKNWRLSPDAIVQMALQMTNYKTRGHFVMTYEAGLARIFKDGRTETIRSCSQQSIRFVKEMMDKSSDRVKQKKALQDAVRHHGALIKQAMIGEGVDRHLFALCVVLAGTKLESDFLTKYKNAKWDGSKVNGWGLSTSCTPNGMGEYYNPKKYPKLLTMGGGFGWTNGFGVGYSINDESLIFHTSCSKIQNLSAVQFNNNLQESLIEISSLFE